MPVLLDVPGWRRLEIRHLVLDLNGTVALDGVLLPGVARAVTELSRELTCHLVTADTFGTASELFGPAVSLALISPGDEGGQKLALVQELGADHVAALGNGANDAQMLQAACLGVAVLGREGACAAALHAADVVVPDPLAGLELLSRPDRLKATLRR